MMLDPQMRALLDANAKARQGLPAFHQQDAPAVRTWLARRFTPYWNRPVLPLARVADRSLSGVPLRLYDPGCLGPGPALMYLHGGGWTIGDLDSHDAVCRRLAFLAGRRVLAVDYRLAPEHPFPAGLDDVLTVLDAVLAGGLREIDPAQVALGGDSAGANLALAATMRRHDDGRSLPRALVLIYGSYRYDLDGEGFRRFGDPYFLLGRDDAAWFWRNYLPVGYAVGSDPRIEPLAGVLDGLPPAYVVACDHDPLLAESTALAARLGDGAALDVWPGLVHGAMQFFPVLDQAVVGIERIARWLRAHAEPAT